MAGVFYCGPTNSTHFTTCCRVAVTYTDQKCPRCGEYVHPFYEGMHPEDERAYMAYHGHRFGMARNSLARNRPYG